jgi:hypothetical protein
MLFIICYVLYQLLTNKIKNMEININNKILVGEFNESGELVIPINEESELLFFQEWISRKRDVMLKKDYVRDFDFTNGYERGTLFNCQPILHKNMNCVKLICDYNSGHLELPCS